VTHVTATRRICESRSPTSPSGPGSGAFVVGGLKVVVREKDNELRELIPPSCVFSIKPDASGIS
jgi:hypothetical protein